MRSHLVLLAFAAASFAVPQDPDRPARPPAAAAADVESVDGIVAALYDVISGPPGPRDWDRMRSLFRPDARLVALGADREGVVQAREFTVDDYVRLAGPRLERDGFHETETGRQVQRYGDLVQVLSGYVIRHGGDVGADAAAAAPMRGVNAIQLFRAAGRFWIANLAFEQEEGGGDLPAALRGGDR